MHQQIVNPAENESSPTIESSLPLWERVMREAVRTSQAAPANVALKAYQQALEIAHRLIGQPLQDVPMTVWPRWSFRITTWPTCTLNSAI